MQVQELELPGVLLIQPQVFGDSRGYFLETWNRNRYRAAGIDVDFVQSNVSRSARGVLRGLHYQHPKPQGKLVYVLEGSVYDVAVDIRPNSPSFGHWVGHTLDAERKQQLYVPPGYAHGFCVTSGHAMLCYLCTTHYDPLADAAIRWDDPRIAVQWPIDAPKLSGKDAAAPLLADIDPDRLPKG